MHIGGLWFHILRWILEYKDLMYVLDLKCSKGVNHEKNILFLIKSDNRD